MENYQIIYDSFWKSIVENEDGSLNLDQIKKELSDYHAFMDTAAIVYMHITDGKISKINTTAEAIISVAEECEEKRHILKPDPDQDFVHEDRIFIEDISGNIEYFFLIYSVEEATWLLIPFTDKHFTTELKTEGRVIAVPLSEYGYDVMQRLDEFNFEELK